VVVSVIVTYEVVLAVRTADAKCVVDVTSVDVKSEFVSVKRLVVVVSVSLGAPETGANKVRVLVTIVLAEPSVPCTAVWMIVGVVVVTTVVAITVGDWVITVVTVASVVVGGIDVVLTVTNSVSVDVEVMVLTNVEVVTETNVLVTVTILDVDPNVVCVTGKFAVLMVMTFGTVSEMVTVVATTDVAVVEIDEETVVCDTSVAVAVNVDVVGEVTMLVTVTVPAAAATKASASEAREVGPAPVGAMHPPPLSQLSNDRTTRAVASPSVDGDATRSKAKALIAGVSAAFALHKAMLKTSRASPRIQTLDSARPGVRPRLLHMPSNPMMRDSRPRVKPATHPHRDANSAARIAVARRPDGPCRTAPRTPRSSRRGRTARRSRDDL
jgi:hypothetical protein